MQEKRTLHQMRQDITRQLEIVGISNAFDEAKWLIKAALKADPGIFILNKHDPLSGDLVCRVNAFVERRLQRVPLSRIQGEREFWSLPFRLNEGTLDPRPDSEILVESALGYIPEDQPYTILDLGTGSGCLLISILHERPQSQGIGIDLSSLAAQQAHENSILNGVEDRSLFIGSSWGEALKESCFDMIISNPPYIPSSESDSLEPEVCQYDPDLALYGGEKGLDCYRMLAPEVHRLLKPGGTCFLEIGHTQGDDVQAIFEVERFAQLNREKDLSGKERVLVLRGC